MNDFNGRSHPRYRITASADIHADGLTDGLFLYQKVENLSLGGICILTDNPEPIGSSVEVSINFDDDGSEMVIQGQVVWNRTQPASLMGVRFQSMNRIDRERLNAHIFRAANPPEDVEV